MKKDIYDSEEYLPKSRKLFRSFQTTRLHDFLQADRHSRVGPGSGYSDYHRSSEVRQHMFDIVSNLQEHFGFVQIPQKFSSPKQLAFAWNRFYQFLVEREDLFKDIIDKYSTSEKELPYPFGEVYRCHLDIKNLLEEIVSMGEVQQLLGQVITKTGSSSSDKFDIVIITALYKTEFEALLNLPIEFVPYIDSHDSTMYYEGRLEDKRILIATDDKMGMAASAALSTKVISRFSPNYLFMTGIAAGVKDREKNYGDILVCRFTWNYESGKYKYKRDLKATVFEPNPEQIEIHSDLVPLVNNLSSNSSLLKDIENKFQVDNINLKPHKELKVFFGPTASGSAVVADKVKIQDIIKNNRKLIGLDMETFGVYYAAKSYRNDVATKVLSIKSISDFADRRKNDKYRNYAAYTSSMFTYMFIKEKLT